MSAKIARLGRIHLNATDAREWLDTAENYVRGNRTDLIFERVAEPDYVEVWEVHASPAVLRRYEREDTGRMRLTKPKRRWLTPEWRAEFAQMLRSRGVLA